MNTRKSRLCFFVCFLAAAAVCAAPVEVGSRRELFVDHHLIQRLQGCSLILHEPHDAGVAISFDEPWEGPFCAYCTVLRDGDRWLAYYRGKAASTADGQDEITCVAQSTNGIHWVKPSLSIHSWKEHRTNNIILSAAQLSHNFSPLLDANPKADPRHRFKALGGTSKSGLVAFGSPDGVRWQKLSENPVLTAAQVGSVDSFDSQNVAFWSETEQRYVLYFRKWHEGKRRIMRAESKDFLSWTNLVLMEYRLANGAPAPVEELYTSQTHPYFRAPHIYVALAARFIPGRQVLTREQAEAVHIHPNYFKDASDAVFLTTRGGAAYDRTFMSGFIRPGIGAQNWASRSTYPALNVVQTGPHEMSCYVNQDYAQPTAHLRRYSMRLDGFASLRGTYEGGEALTKLLTFQGNRLFLNFSTSAAGGIHVEIQNQAGEAIKGFSRSDCVEIIGNELERAVRWNGGEDVSALSGKPVRLKFFVKDADLFALRFGS